MLLLTLAPALSHAFGAASRAAVPGLQICSASGQKNLAGAVAGAAAGEAAAMAAAHCPFCLGHADAAPLPAGQAAGAALSGAAPRYPTLFYRSPRPLFLWASAQSRAPPALS